MLNKEVWEKDLYRKIVKDKKDRILLSSTIEPQSGFFMKNKQNKRFNQSGIISTISSNLNQNVFHVMKFLPYKKSSRNNGGENE